MKRKVRFFVPLLALLVMLCACGSKDGGDGETARKLGDTVYRPTYLDTAMGADTRINVLLDACVGDTYAYFLGDGDQEEGGYRILRLPLDGGALEAMPYAPAADAVPEGAEGHVTTAALAAAGDGALWVQEAVSYSFYELPEDFDPETGNKWDYRTGGGWLHILRRIASDGTEERRIDLSALAAELGVESVQADSLARGYLYSIQTPLLDFAEDGAGDLYLLTEGKLCVLDEAGETRFTLDWKEEGGSLVVLGDGTVAAFYHPSNFRVKDTLWTVDPEGRKWGDKYAPINAVEDVWPGSGEWLYFYDGGDGLYGWDAESGGAVVLAAWEEAALDPGLIQRCAGLPDGRIVLLSMRSGGLEAVVLSEVGRDTVPETETLVYALLHSDNVDWELVNEFNRTHTDIQISVKDYTVYAEDGSITSQGRDRLLTELAAGQVPDILDLGSSGTTFGCLPLRQLVEKGYLEDLLPYIDGDPELGREALMEAPLRAALVDGGLYMAFDSVAISNTFLGPERIVGDRTSWTLAELLEAFAAMPEGSTISDYGYTKKDMLYYLVSPDDYVDWETGTCSFDSDSFRAALELVNSYPTEFEWPGGDDIEAILAYNEELDRRKREGLQMVTEATIYSPVAALYYAREDVGFGEPVAFVGHPTEDGSAGSSFRAYGKLAMSSTCKNKEAAWEFIRECFLPKCDMSLEEFREASYENKAKSDLLFGLSINRADFELAKQYYMEPYTEEELERLEKSRETEGRGYTPPLTEEEYQRFMDFYNRVEKMELGNDALSAIIEEQCGPYFAGDRTLDETVDQIQRRAELYVNEVR